MEKDFRFGFHYPAWSNFERPNFHFDTGPVSMNTHSIEDSMLRSSPVFPVSLLHQARTSEPTDAQEWFHGVPVLNSALRQKNDHFTADTKPRGKRFLVFDRSGDKTTLIQLGGYRIADPPASNEELTGSVNSLRPSLAEENVEDSSRDFEEDEMHEDTEELNALLWSDDETDDNEEASTGHSPSTMTDNGAQDLAEEAGEEVNSIIQAAKRQKLMNGGYDLKTTFLSYALDDNAESHLVREVESGSLSGKTRSRKEMTIHERVSLLRRIIPNANGKSAVMVIDEAISYLRSLQVKANALGIEDDI